MVGVRQGSEAADTGSAIHRAAKVWHDEKDYSVAVGAMRHEIDRYPLADLDTAEKTFRHYASDKRNQEAEVVYLEKEIELEIEPAETDPTQEKIYIKGTLDQIRRSRGHNYVWDIKTGKRLTGFQMLQEHCWQLCIYWISALTLVPIIGAGVIRTQDYYTRNQQVFWEAPWSQSHAEHMIKSLAYYVANVRRGDIAVNPGEPHCGYCLGGIANCVPQLKEIRGADIIQVDTIRTRPHAALHASAWDKVPQSLVGG